ncbi:MAG: hypothetical protein JNL54_01410 [Kineosporiaceae bacterium]|nr:hypothetical protein [Kineosporiaceae bacterium]
MVWDVSRAGGNPPELNNLTKWRRLMYRINSYNAAEDEKEAAKRRNRPCPLCHGTGRRPGAGNYMERCDHGPTSW